MRRTKLEAENMAFTTQLFYFSMKSLFCYILYKYKTVLDQTRLGISLYLLLLIANTYMILTTGRDPGYEQGGPSFRPCLS